MSPLFSDLLLGSQPDVAGRIPYLARKTPSISWGNGSVLAIQAIVLAQ